MAFGRSWELEGLVSTGSTGFGEISRLPQTNIDRLRQPMNVQELPGASLQAIFITAKLGFKYLWVYCHCLFHDGDGTRQNESHQTSGMVYAHTSCIVSAAKSPALFHHLALDSGPVSEVLLEANPGSSEFQSALVPQMLMNEISRNGCRENQHMFQEPC